MNILDLIINDKQQVVLAEVCLSEENTTLITQFLDERQQIALLREYGLPVNNKLLLTGCTGCGKTTTAKAIATTLARPLYVLNLSTVVSARIGETAQHLKLVFDKVAREQAILFLDEFDQIGKARGHHDTDVGEMRRLVNSLIQLIDRLPENALLICATNHLDAIDTALLRRFQVTMEFELPSKIQLEAYYEELLSKFPEPMRDIELRFDISYAQAKDHAFNQLKIKVLSRCKLINPEK